MNRRRSVRQQRIGVHHLVILVDAEMEMRWRVSGVAGVADEAEKIAGLHFHALVEPWRPAVEMRIEE